MRLWTKIRRRKKKGAMVKKTGWLDGIFAKAKKASKRKIRQAVRTQQPIVKTGKGIDFRMMVRSRVFNYVIVVIVIYMAVLTGKEALANFYQTKQLQKIENENNVIRQNNQELAYLLEYYKTETYAELEARKYLNLKKKGEEVAVVSGDNQSVENMVEEEDNKIESRSNPKKWWDFLFADISKLPD